MEITVLGAGTWGTALAILLSKNGHKVTLWSALENEISELKADRSNIPRLKGAVLPKNIILTNDIPEAFSRKPGIVVFATASIFIRTTAKMISRYVNDNTIIVNVAKGIESDSLKTLTEVIAEELPKCEICVLSGPTHAEEVAVHIPSTIVVGTKTRKTAEIVQDAFMTDYFRVYISPDILGIELGGSLKNVIALAAGMTDGLGFGDNTKAALMTRGIAEITRLGIKMGGQPETFAGLSGMGDLMVTCTSLHSRNRNAGFLIGQGMSVENAMKEVGQTVEGVYCAKAAKKLSEAWDCEMPIADAVCRVLFEGQSAKEAAYDLFTRDKTVEYTTLDWVSTEV